MAAGLAIAATVNGADKTAAQTCQLGGVSVPGFNTTTLEPAQFRALHAAVAPRGETERWMEIPWEPDLAKARERAAREGKPLLMWIMDGHPLGCT
jgi:hypothetical protein